LRRRSDVRRGLDKLIDAVDAMTEASEVRPRVPAEATVLRVRRLRLQDDAGRHPEIGERPIVFPRVVTNAPRSGTTWLYELLALDPMAPRDRSALPYLRRYSPRRKTKTNNSNAI